MRSSNHFSAWFHRLLPSMVPAILISVGYIDPGKWAATIEGGVYFGFDLVLLMLTFNLAAILCQYLAARVGAITGKDLAAVYLLLSPPYLLIYDCHYVYCSCICHCMYTLNKYFAINVQNFAIFLCLSLCRCAYPNIFAVPCFQHVNLC